jgi:hypothetical protein
MKLGAVTRDSLPPCGGGMGWGVVQYGTAVPHRTTPTPIPSPQGGGEEFAIPANRICDAVGLCRFSGLLPMMEREYNNAVEARESVCSGRPMRPWFSIIPAERGIRR